MIVTHDYHCYIPADTCPLLVDQVSWQADIPLRQSTATAVLA